MKNTNLPKDVLDYDGSWEGDLKDLNFWSNPVNLHPWCIKFQNEYVILDTSKSKGMYETKNKALSDLKRHLFKNFLQGHYWHKGKNNTFTKFKGLARNNGIQAGLDEDFTELTKRLMKNLLEKKIFTVEQI